MHTIPSKIHRRAALFAVCLIGASTLLLISGASKAQAYGRDADGTRHQARNQALGSTQRDTLNPPSDGVDWRSFKVTAPKNITVSLRHKPEAAKVTVTIVDSTGATVASGSSSRGAVSVTSLLKSGLYYISVSSNQGVSYSITVQ